MFVKIAAKICILNRKAVSFLNRIHFRFMAKLVARPRQFFILTFLKKRYKNLLSVEYDYNFLEKIPVSERKIFVMWFQGEKQMPEVVKKCYESIKKASEALCEVVLVTEENINDLILLPDFILQKYHKGFISRTTLSDIIRNGLLAKYGGTWIDSTVFLTSKLPLEYIEKDFYCPVNVGNSVITEWKYLYGKSKGWTFWFCGSMYKNFPLFDFVYNSFIEYYRTEDVAIDYYQLDFTIALFYRYNKEFKKIVDSLQENNCEAYILMELLQEEASAENIKKYENLMKSCFINKLTYKRNYQRKTLDGKQTMYDYVLF